jgi:chloramphenicol-sensitive protein RarD
MRLVMMAAGPITAIPLLLFAAGARRIRLSTLGLLQFIAPTLQLLLGIWMFHEPFGGARMWGFVIIWAALALFSAEWLLRSWWIEPQAAATSHAPTTD